MTSSGDPRACARCGGDLVDGSLALPMLGRAKFAYDLRGRSIETDVDARMCTTCGAITFTAADLERIRRAALAGARAGRLTR